MVNVFQHSFLFEFKIMCWKEFIQKNCLKISSKKVSKIFASFNRSTCFEHFSIFGPELWICIVFKKDRWIKPKCHVRPPSWSDKAILTFSPLRLHVRVYSLATTFQPRCISITFVNKLEPLVVGCWRRIHADWCGSEQYCVKKCVKKWGEQELDVLILAALCMGIEMNVVASRDPWILHMIGNSIRY